MITLALDIALADLNQRTWRFLCTSAERFDGIRDTAVKTEILKCAYALGRLMPDVTTVDLSDPREASLLYATEIVSVAVDWGYVSPALMGYWDTQSPQTDLRLQAFEAGMRARILEDV